MFKMNYKWCYLVLLGAAFVSTTASSYENFQDFSSNEYVYDDSNEIQNPIVPEEKDIESIYNESENNVDEEIQLFRPENEAKEEPVKEIEPQEDYQYEDNRSKDKEELEENSDKDKVETIDENASDEDEVDFDEAEDTLEVDEAIDAKKTDDVSENNRQDEVANDYALLWGDIQEKEALSKINDSEKKILEETQDILKADEEQGIDLGEKNVDVPVNSKENDDIPEDQKLDAVAKDYALLWGDIQEQSALSKIKDDEGKIIEETQSILEADNEQGIDFGKKVDEDSQIDEKLLEETRRILEDTNNNFENNEDTNEKNNDETNTVDKLFEEFKKTLDDIANETDIDYEEEIKDLEKSDENKSKTDIQGGAETDDEVVKNSNEDEDTPEKVYADLNADLDKLLETIDKLQDDGDDNKDEMFNDALNMNPLDYEEKYGKPYREGIVLSFRDDYDNSIFEDSDKSNENTAAEVLEPEVNIDKVKDDEDQIDTSLDSEPFPDDGSLFMDAIKDDKDTSTAATHLVEPLIYGNDAFVVDSKNDDYDDGENQLEKEESINSDDSENEKNVAVDKISVNNLSSSELEELTEQFSALHKDELDTQSENFDQHVAPVHISLNVNEPVIITSPNYPNAYPTNNIIDWIFDGEGVGIELNITDFAINSALGDFLLVKPGGLDETGNDGLVFAYRLNSEKRYRFTDVDRMFVRFESKPGMAFLRGFQFSVRMISPLPEEPEPIPESEPVVNPPTETLTLNLGGVTLTQFRMIEEEFRLLIAEMAARYIRGNDIAPGLIAPIDNTQITSTALCNVHWPGYENCVEVTFGIPLSYEDEELEPRLNKEDLQTMWSTYNSVDPFALQLRRLGITEFVMPNDRSVMTVWLLIASGVVICMVMLVVTLWRFSCVENYTRMKAQSDTDSLQSEKRGLDLYPTPHQPLPPLYSENDYKWADDKFDDSTRVDMGGFANKSYERTDMFDFDSDEDVIIPRDSNAATKQRDFYKNV